MNEFNKNVFSLQILFTRDNHQKQDLSLSIPVAPPSRAWFLAAWILGTWVHLAQGMDVCPRLSVL
jgi:hypothetical protein